MDAKIKAALAVGGGLLVLNLGLGLVCQALPVTLTVIGGALAGWLAISWAKDRDLEESPAAEGAIAGTLAGIAGFLGQVGAAVINALFVVSTPLENPFSGIPFTEQEAAAGGAFAVVCWGCAGMAAVAASVGAAALAAKYAAERPTLEPFR